MIYIGEIIRQCLLWQPGDRDRVLSIGNFFKIMNEEDWRRTFKAKRRRQKKRTKRKEKRRGKAGQIRRSPKANSARGGAHHTRPRCPH